MIISTKQKGSFLSMASYRGLRVIDVWRHASAIRITTDKETSSS